MASSSFIVPPGGFAGFQQMTPASRASLFPGGSRRATTGRRRRKKSASRKTTRAKRGGGRKMKFGSPAWQKKYRVGKFAKKKR